MKTARIGHPRFREPPRVIIFKGGVVTTLCRLREREVHCTVTSPRVLDRQARAPE